MGGMMERPRPEGFDYTKPDPVDVRCPICNQDGMNRTGLRPVCYWGASSTCICGVRCNCNNGLIPQLKNEKNKIL